MSSPHSDRAVVALDGGVAEGGRQGRQPAKFTDTLPNRPVLSRQVSTLTKHDTLTLLLPGCYRRDIVIADNAQLMHTVA